MPIIETNGTIALTDTTGKKKTSAAAKKMATPSFFNKNVLTGNGKTRGLLTELRNPNHYPNGYHVMVNDHCKQSTTTNGDTTTYNIPFYMIEPSGWDRIIETFEPESLNTMPKIATKNGVNVYLDVFTHAAQVDEKKIYDIDDKTGMPKASTVKDMSVCFQMFVYFEADATKTVFRQLKSSTNGYTTTKPIMGGIIPCDVDKVKSNVFFQKIVYNLYEELKALADELNANGYFVDKDTMNDYFRDYDLYSNISKAADRIVNHMDEYIVDTLAKNLTTQNASSYYDPYRFLVTALENLEKYDVPITMYNTMYHKMTSVVPANELKRVCRANLNMRLSDTLHNMDTNRASLKSCPNNVPLSQTVTDIPYSIEQTNAIESTSPLTLVQSGAGTGKSTIILGRIQHMIDNGIDPKKILVLSFTNNAADNILDRNPNVNSMTIDKMMRLIYMENYPDHQLSSISTIINSIDIYYDQKVRPMTQQQIDFTRQLSHILQRLRDKSEYTNALNFISDHTAEVIDVLDTIKQTSLELQGIICYLNMATLKEPVETQTEHLIIDEVQDNSIAQFIYCIGYTEKHKNSMYIVGDCSQTLYEFRSSNPKALNMLEASGVFATYKLQTNYRSNQSILDFANIALANIDANKFANIQLHSNSLAQITPTEFKEAVTVTYSRMPNKSDATYEATFEASIRGASDWIMDKIKKGEQVAFLARTRRDLDKIEKYLLKKFPQLPVIDKATHQPKLDAAGNQVMEQTRIISLVPKRQYDNTVFSKFIAGYWNTVKYAPPTDIISTIECEMLAHASQIAFRAGNASIVQNIITNTIANFRNECGGRIKSLQNNVQASVITQQKMLNEIKEMMIRFEISKNSIAQAVMASRNNDAKTAELRDNAHFIKSTVHSAKGLEFDNVMVYYDGGTDDNMDEPTKRVYYVAFTRAKKSEYVFAYDRLAKPKIVNDYDRLIAMLEAIEKANKKAAASGTNTTDDTANEQTDDESKSTDATDEHGELVTTASTN